MTKNSGGVEKHSKTILLKDRIKYKLSMYLFFYACTTRLFALHEKYLNVCVNLNLLNVIDTVYARQKRKTKN